MSNRRRPKSDTKSRLEARILCLSKRREERYLTSYFTRDLADRWDSQWIDEGGGIIHVRIGDISHLVGCSRADGEGRFGLA